MTIEYPSENKQRDEVVELLCDEWPSSPVWLEWEDRCSLVCQLLDVLDKNKLSVTSAPSILQDRIDRADHELSEALDVITGWCRPDLWGDLPIIERLCYKALDILREQDTDD